MSLDNEVKNSYFRRRKEMYFRRVTGLVDGIATPYIESVEWDGDVDN